MGCLFDAQMWTCGGSQAVVKSSPGVAREGHLEGHFRTPEKVMISDFEGASS